MIGRFRLDSRSASTSRKPDEPLRLADVLVQQLRALDVQEEALALAVVARGGDRSSGSG
jgi:hypothetical protein